MARATAAVEGGEARGNLASTSNSDVGADIEPSFALEAGDGSSSGKKTGGSTAIRTVTFANGDTYEGELKDRKRHGRGIQKWGGGNVYDGEWKDDLHHGNGTMTLARFYDGGWTEGKMQGKGTFRFANGNLYEGEWKGGKMHGKGTLTHAGGAVYEGEYKEGERHGQGRMKFASGEVCNGEWKDGKEHGQGTFTSSDIEYKGQFVGGLRHGQGALRQTIGTGTFYEGEFVDGLRHGWGSQTWVWGNVYEGEWVANNQHGKGTVKNSAGRTLCEGVWVNGVQQGNEEGVGVNAATFPNALARSEVAAPSSSSREQPGEDKRVCNHERTVRSERSQQRQLQKSLAPKNCEHCGVGDGQYKLRVCSGCNLALYCSAVCQKAASGSHRRICNILSMLPSRDSDRLTLEYDAKMVDFDAGLRYGTKYMDHLRHLQVNLLKIGKDDAVKLSAKQLSSLFRTKKGALDTVFWLSKSFFGFHGIVETAVWKELHGLKQLRLEFVRFDDVQSVHDIISHQTDTLEVLCLPFLGIPWYQAKSRRAIAQAVAPCKHLVQLDLYGSVLMDADLKIMLGDLPNLRILRLARDKKDRHEITDNTCGLIARKCPGLQELDLDFHHQLSVRGIRKIFEGCPHFRSFVTTARKLSCNDVRSLLDIAPQLMYLSLGDEVGISAGELNKIIEATGGKTVLQLRYGVFVPDNVSTKTKLEYDLQLGVLNKIWSKRNDPVDANEWAGMFEG